MTAPHRDRQSCWGKEGTAKPVEKRLQEHLELRNLLIHESAPRQVPVGEFTLSFIEPVDLHPQLFPEVVYLLVQLFLVWDKRQE